MVLCWQELLVVDYWFVVNNLCSVDWIKTIWVEKCQNRLSVFCSEDGPRKENPAIICQFKPISFFEQMFCLLVNQTWWIEQSKIKRYLSNPHTMYYYSSIYFLYKIFVPSEMWTHFYVQTLYFLNFQVWTFDLRNPKIQTSQILSFSIIINPNWTKIAQKIPNQFSSWPWGCCAHTFGEDCL